jgi:hypothetical protein
MLKFQKRFFFFFFLGSLGLLELKMAGLSIFFEKMTFVS